MAPFRLLLRVRYGECDAQQVVFNARYGDYVDVAATEFYRTSEAWRVTLDPAPVIRGRQYVMVDARAFTKVAIPEAIRALLERGAPGVTVNQAG